MSGQCVETRLSYNMNKLGKSWNLEYSRPASITSNTSKYYYMKSGYIVALILVRI